jgi:hypothetical protein
MRIGAILVASGLGLLLFGIFAITRARPCETASCGVDVNAIAYGVGLVLLSLGAGRFFWTGWHGSGMSWVIAAAAAGILAWTLYELIRQGVPLYGIGILGEMTAPTVTVVVGIGVIVIGWLRQTRHRVTLRDAD